MTLVQACASPEAPATRERELRALSEAMTETGCRQATVVTLNDRESVELAAWGAWNSSSLPAADALCQI